MYVLTILLFVGFCRAKVSFLQDKPVTDTDHFLKKYAAPKTGNDELRLVAGYSPHEGYVTLGCKWPGRVKVFEDSPPLKYIVFNGPEGFEVTGEMYGRYDWQGEPAKCSDSSSKLQSWKELAPGQLAGDCYSWASSQICYQPETFTLVTSKDSRESDKFYRPNSLYGIVGHILINGDDGDVYQFEDHVVYYIDPSREYVPIKWDKEEEINLKEEEFAALYGFLARTKPKKIIKIVKDNGTFTCPEEKHLTFDGIVYIKKEGENYVAEIGVNRTSHSSTSRIGSCLYSLTGNTAEIVQKWRTSDETFNEVVRKSILDSCGRGCSFKMKTTPVSVPESSCKCSQDINPCTTENDVFGTVVVEEKTALKYFTEKVWSCRMLGRKSRPISIADLGLDLACQKGKRAFLPETGPSIFREELEKNLYTTPNLG